MSDKPTGRVIVVIALLILAAAALRGYLPAQHGSRLAEAGGNRAALTMLVTAIAATLAILVFSIIARLRDPRAVAPSAGQLPEMVGRGTGRPNWRVVLIALGAIVAWLLIALLLSRILAPHEVSVDAPNPDSSASTSAPGTAPPPKPLTQHKKNGDMLGILIACTPVLLLVVAAGVIVSRRRRPTTTALVAQDDAPKTTPPPQAAESLARAAEVGLAEIADLSREPREAIIACYAAMERELADVPGAAPQEFDTPTEVLARAVERHALQADNAVQLVELFAEARFSPHVMSEGHREVAVRVLQLVRDELSTRSPA
ncbi:DUF4129 domain-containing protein [Mycobacterium szulgai]|uniref:Protein-glutamine gamma-glutamyltransferase-like C-terminal domain-containing protein n=1 Tax=Mycobacterium szulgai TaxID=1787 RepID=A0A1X2F6Z2_MYCSZ|nr:DUF4129 domain-containing protein [Mycobacterium szulgai]MCV7078700.1 DUF4129 domain-containing protein [Mycobacterium szulgai]ORX14192.1 hypothetical protein AWC27_19845 [Mycobacterium szulgai]